MENKFQQLFSVKKPIIGMIHLAGSSQIEIVKRAIGELIIYEQEGVDGAIIEDYHADGQGLNNAVTEICQEQWTIKLGVNYLRNPGSAFEIAQVNDLSFIQLDSVQGSRDRHLEQRKALPYLAVFGGVRFKYQPSTGMSLEEDIVQGKLRCDAIVTTGEGTGIETPLQKLREFRKHLQASPLIVGAGVDLANVYSQLIVADAAIVGSYFKPEKNTYARVSRDLVREFMEKVKEVRLIESAE